MPISKGLELNKDTNFVLNLLIGLLKMNNVMDIDHVPVDWLLVIRKKI